MYVCGVGVALLSAVQAIEMQNQPRHRVLIHGGSAQFKLRFVSFVLSFFQSVNKSFKIKSSREEQLYCVCRYLILKGCTRELFGKINSFLGLGLVMSFNGVGSVQCHSKKKKPSLSLFEEQNIEVRTEDSKVISQLFRQEPSYLCLEYSLILLKPTWSLTHAVITAVIICRNTKNKSYNSFAVSGSTTSNYFGKSPIHVK